MKKFSAFEEESPKTTYSSEFLGALLSVPTLTRNIAFAGHLHSGKTSFLDMLIEQVGFLSDIHTGKKFYSFYCHFCRPVYILFQNIRK